jgi:hypothetical protein
MRLCVFSLLFAALPAVAHADSGWWDTIEGFSGPGPFTGFTVSMRVHCIREYGDSEKTYQLGWCVSDIDDNIKVLINVEGGFYSSGSNPRFKDTPNDTAAVHLTRIHSTYMYRVSPVIDVGVGAGFMIFSGSGFDNQVHGVLTPVSVTFTPFGFLRKGPTALATKWGRALRVNFTSSFVTGDIRAIDFNSPSTYLRNGEFNSKLGIGFDWGSFRAGP